MDFISGKTIVNVLIALVVWSVLDRMFLGAAITKITG